jgi:altronate dehydratase small subunit
MPLKFIVINTEDNVATALMPLTKGESLSVGSTSSVIITLLKDIPLGHKFALKDIMKGTPLIKYGETIGSATEDIKKGDHVHVHNVEGLRGRGDRV